jgi:hypothetical protein
MITPEFAAETGVNQSSNSAIGRLTARSAPLALSRRGQSVGLADRAPPLLSTTGSVGPGGGVGLHLSNSSCRSIRRSRRRPTTGTSCSFRRNTRSPFRDELPAAASSQGKARQARRLFHARLQRVDEPDNFVDGDADRHDTIGLHVALTPTWSETAWFADYILPMGLVRRRHDEPGDARRAVKLGFRQPVLRVAREEARETFGDPRDESGEVWEERVLGGSPGASILTVPRHPQTRIALPSASR